MHFARSDQTFPLGTIIRHKRGSSATRRTPSRDGTCQDNVIKSPMQSAGLTSLLLQCPYLGIMDRSTSSVPCSLRNANLQTYFLNSKDSKIVMYDTLFRYALLFVNGVACGYCKADSLSLNLWEFILREKIRYNNYILYVVLINPRGRF